MRSDADSLTHWDDRIARARRLATEHADAADLLTFYASLAEYQKRMGSDPIFTKIVSSAPGQPQTYDLGKNGVRPRLRDRLDPNSILSAIPELLAWLRQNAPTTLAMAIGQLQVAHDRLRWKEVLDTVLEGNENETVAGLEAFVVEVVVQPFAEQLAMCEPLQGKRFGRAESRCLRCGGAPVLGVLREEGHGAKRTLLCGLCLTEQDFLRVVCPACDEQRFDALPIYTADRFGYVRLDACDSCWTYLKTIDLTKDATAVPVADDLASVCLDLWARDRGYRRLRPNLLRI
jgi:FdhE protein